ncbi:MAG: iron ABC transporter permease [Betaproteobacteria bacterium]|nr:iron ABC transporter permease [Betaproteobacteria bacterium]
MAEAARPSAHRWPTVWSVAPGAGSLVLAALPLGFLVLLLLAPALRLLAEAGWSEAGWLTWFSPWTDDYLRWRMLWSGVQAALTCVLVLVLGVPVAWVLARMEFPGRGLLLRALMLPFVVPTLVAAMGVLALLGPRGVLQQCLPYSLEQTPWLLLYGNVFFNLCILVRAATEALEQVSASRVAAARTLGATPWRAFWLIEWPAILPWLMSALCLVFLYCFSGFGLALLLGGPRYATVEVEIYTLVAHELQLTQAGVLAAWMLLTTGLCALAYSALERRLATPLRADRIARQRPRRAAQWLAVVGCVAVLAMLCGAPVAAIVWRALSAGPQAWAVLADADTLQALWNTLRFSACALALATLLGVCHALAARRWAVLRALAFLPFVVSPILVAFGLLLLYPSWTASAPLLVAAYALLAYPFVATSLAAGLDGMPASYLAAARTLGANPWRAFWRITWPLLQPALRRGMAFAAATAVGEFAVTLFLSRPEWATLTTMVYEQLSQPGASRYDAALVLACALMALALAVFVLLEWPWGADSRGEPDHA